MLFIIVAKPHFRIVSNWLIKKGALRALPQPIASLLPLPAKLMIYTVDTKLSEKSQFGEKIAKVLQILYSSIMQLQMAL